MWINGRLPFFCRLADRLVFLDETSTNTKLTKRTGWSPCGERYRTHAPFGAWQTQTFVAGLRNNSLTAPWLVDAPMNREIFEVYVETQLAPTLGPHDVVILDNVAFHKGPTVEALIRARGAWLLFLPPYSPDLNPIEMAFPNSKHTCASERPERSTPSSKPLVTSAICSRPPNASVFSELSGLRQIKCDRL